MDTWFLLADDTLYRPAISSSVTAQVVDSESAGGWVITVSGASTQLKGVWPDQDSAFSAMCLLFRVSDVPVGS
jgi:hypothetical protein